MIGKLVRISRTFGLSALFALSLSRSAFSFECTGEHKFLLSKLSFSAPVAERICHDEKQMHEITRRYRRAPESCQMVRVYRGVPIDPANYVPTRIGDTGAVWVGPQIHGWPLSKATVWYDSAEIQLAKDQGRPIYGTVVEFEVPRFLVPNFPNERLTLQFTTWGDPGAAVAVYTARIGKIDVLRALAEKASKIYRSEECLRLMHPENPDYSPLIEWTEF
jgi:hypothetical protein